MNLDRKYIEPPEMPTKYCPKCEGWLPESEFYVRTLSPDGLTSLCKTHHKENAHRAYHARKKCVPVADLSRLSPQELIASVIRGGARTQAEIKHATKHLTDDERTDAIAMLWDTNQLDRASLRRREYRLRAA